MGDKPYTITQNILELFRYYYLLFFRIHFIKNKKKSIQNINKYKNKGILTFISSRPHLFNMNYFIWKNYRAEELLCLINNESLIPYFNNGEQPLFISKNDLPSIDLKAWRQSFLKIYQPTLGIIKTFLHKNDLPITVGWKIMNFLMVQTQYLVAFDHLLKILQPKFILVEHDRYSWCSCLILSAKKLHVPTFTMMHGVVNNQFGYLPILSDYLFCWGERQKRLLENYGGHSEHLVVTGGTQLDPSINISKQTVRKRLDITDNKKVVLLATNPVRPIHRQNMVQIFCQAVKQNEDIVGVVRLHPSEDLIFYAEYMKKYPKILFYNNNQVSFEESFALADIVCIYNSAYGMDAALKGLPVMIINIDNEDLGQAKDLIEYGDFPVAKNITEFSEMLSSYLKDSNYRNQVDANIKMYAQKYCGAFENDAAYNMIGFIQSKLKLDDYDIEPKLDVSHV